MINAIKKKIKQFKCNHDVTEHTQHQYSYLFDVYCAECGKYLNTVDKKSGDSDCGYYD